MSYVTNRPHQVAPDHRVKIPRSRVREMLDRLGASMSRKTTRPGAAEFGATFNPERAGSVPADVQAPGSYLRRAFMGASRLTIAAERYRAAVAAARPLTATPEGGGDAVSAAEQEFYANATAAMPLTTFRDAMAVVAWIRGEFAAAAAISPESDESPSFEAFTNRALKEVHEFLSHVQEDGETLGSAANTSVIPSLGLTFREAADRVNERLTLANNSAARDPDEDGPAGQQRRAWVLEQIGIRQAIASTPAATMGDVLVKLEMLAHPEVGAGTFEVEPDDLNAIARDLAVMSANSLAPAGAGDAEALRLFLQWRAGVEANQRDPDHEDAAERENVPSAAFAQCPIQGILGVVLKLGYYLEFAQDHYAADGDDHDHPTVHAHRTLLEAAERIGGPVGDAVRFAALGSLQMHKQLHAEASDAWEWRKRADKAGTQVDQPVSSINGVPITSRSTRVRLLCGIIGETWDEVDQTDGFVDQEKPLGARLTALEQAVLNLEPHTLADVACQAALAANEVGIVIDGLQRSKRSGQALHEDVGRAATTVRRILEGVRDLLGKATGTDFQAVGLGDYLPPAGRASARSDQEPRSSDTFADTVAAFEAEAPAPLCMPQSPTAAMLEAATAAGVSQEQALAMYEAMAEAYRKERAA